MMTHYNKSGRKPGSKPWNYGKTGVQEAWNKGLPPEKQPNYGRHPSQETKDKISQSQIGKEVSEETRQKQSEVARAAYAAGRAPHNKGKRLRTPEEEKEYQAKRHHDYAMNPENKAQRNKTRQELRRRKKMEVFYVYSKGTMECVSCGEKELDALSLNHIDNNGAESRRKIGGGGHKLYEWIIANNFPEDQNLNLMCMNCQTIYDAPEKKEDNYGQKYRLATKFNCLYHYSEGKMECKNIFGIHQVPYKEFDALSIDHANGEGYKEKPSLRNHLYHTLEKQGYPPGYQVLCMSCQFIKRVRNDEQN